MQSHYRCGRSVAAPHKIRWTVRMLMPAPRARAILAGLWPITTVARSRSRAPDTDTAAALASHSQAGRGAVVTGLQPGGRGQNLPPEPLAPRPDSGRGSRGITVQCACVVLSDPGQRRIIRHDPRIGHAGRHNFGQRGGLGTRPRAWRPRRGPGAHPSLGAWDQSAARARSSRRNACP